MVITDEKARTRFREVSVDGKISCQECFMIADEMGVEMDQIASTLTEMGIKIRNCQLGCFQ